MAKMKADIPVSEVEGDDLFPTDVEEQGKITRWVQDAFKQGDEAKSAHKTRWEKYYKMYRSYVRRREQGEWKSRVWMPVAFYVIETIAPKLVAQLPDFTVKPIGPEDAPAAEVLENLLNWSADKSDLWLELVKATKSSLIYGTGILKTMYDEQLAYMMVREPVMEEQTMDVPTGEFDIDGNPITMTQSMGAQPVLDEQGQPQMQMRRVPYTQYQGPTAEAVDIDNFFVDPVADDISSARWVIHRVYRDKSHIQDMVKKGAYKAPEENVWNNFLTEHATLTRQSLVELGPGGVSSTEKSLFPILECWTDDNVITILGERGNGVLLRYEKNPYGHGEKPFVRVVDHLVPHEFWGIGELEPLEGLQDILNALWNSRIDNVKLVLNTMMMASMDYIEDPTDLQVRPGGVIRVREGLPLNQVVEKLDFGDVTSSSYQEAEEIERMTEKVSGVNPMTEGTEAAPYQRTATGLSIATEAANSRFSHKVLMAERTGFKHLARQYASILQQYMPPEMVVRMDGLNGPLFQTVTQDAIVGRFDFDVEAESSTQSESMRKEQAMSLFQLLFMDPYVKPLSVREDLLKSMGKKDVNKYLPTEQELMMAQQAQAEQQMAAEQAPQEDQSAA